MNNWAEVMEDLKEMAKYFTVCANNAGGGSWAQRYFNKHIKTLEAVERLVQDMVTEEDDRK